MSHVRKRTGSQNVKKMEKSLDSYHSQVRFSLSLHTLGLGELVYLAKVLIIPDWVLR